MFRRHLEADGKIAQRPSKELHSGLFSVILRGSLASGEACVILADEFIAVTAKQVNARPPVEGELCAARPRSARKVPAAGVAFAPEALGRKRRVKGVVFQPTVFHPTRSAAII